MTNPYVGPDLVGGPQPQNLSGTNTRAVVTVEEAVGPLQDTVTVQSFVHLLGRDVHSAQTLYGYSVDPITLADPGVDVYSFERWIRVRFDPPFNAVWGMRFYVKRSFGDGWTVRWGTSPAYQTPVRTQSAIAVRSLPTTDPGAALSNIGGARRLPGTETQYSDWIVMQAMAVPSLSGAGPATGFTAEGTLIPITFNVNWIED